MHAKHKFLKRKNVNIARNNTGKEKSKYKIGEIKFKKLHRIIESQIKQSKNLINNIDNKNQITDQKAVKGKNQKKSNKKKSSHK